MDTFLVRVCKGKVTNYETGTTREGCWIPLEYLPASVAAQLNCDKITARPHLAWDMHKAAWRDMRLAKITGTMFANAAVVSLPSGRDTIAMIDF